MPIFRHYNFGKSGFAILRHDNKIKIQNQCWGQKVKAALKALPPIVSLASIPGGTAAGSM